MLFKLVITTLYYNNRTQAITPVKEMNNSCPGLINVGDLGSTGHQLMLSEPWNIYCGEQRLNDIKNTIALAEQISFQLP